MRRLVFPVALRTVVFAGLLGACGGGGGDGGSSLPPPTTPALVLTTIAVTVSPSALQVGQTATAAAAGLDQHGSPITTGSVTWTSSNSTVATVNAAGTVSALAAGLTNIVATVGTESGQLAISVSAVPITTTVTVALSAASVVQGQTVTATATALDQNGASLAGRTVAWSTASSGVATVTSTGVVTGVATGQTQVIATIDGKQGQAALTVTSVPVASVAVTPTSATIAIADTKQLTATELDASGTTLSGRAVTWATSDATKVTVSAAGLVTGVAAGTAVITATSEGKAGSSTITVSPPADAGCTSTSALQLALGEVRTLTTAQVASLCVGGLSTSSDYVLIPFNNSTLASLTTSVSLTGTNTGSVTTTPDLAPPLSSSSPLRAAANNMESFEPAFRAREQRDIGPLRARALVTSRGRGLGASIQLTGVAATPAVGSVVQLNSNVSGNSCSAAKTLHPARVVAVLTHTIVFIDTLSPPGGYTDAQLSAFGTAFDTLGFALDTLNFGAPTDIDGNGRVGIFFTPGVNQIPGPPGGYIAGLFGGRDLYQASVSGCPASNEGEMFYMAVPDPNKTINSSYGSEATLAGGVLATLVHEFQHLINAGRRMYVNNTQVSEELWLNEGLSHIAEELLYYKESGMTPGQNLNLANVTATTAQVDAINTYQLQNLGRLIDYMAATATNSPYSEVDLLETRGAIWELLRYSADRKGGTGRSIWYPLVNSTTAGQANFNAVFGNITTNTRDWAVAQFIDDDGLNVGTNYTNPSWNFRSILPQLSPLDAFPLNRSILRSSTPLSLSIIGGGAAYVRFSVAAGVAATVVSTSSGAAVPANIDFILVRTR